MREGISSGEISQENITNNRCLAKCAKENWQVHKNLLLETKVGKRKTRENFRTQSLFKHWYPVITTFTYAETFDRCVIRKFSIHEIPLIITDESERIKNSNVVPCVTDTKGKRENSPPLVALVVCLVRPLLNWVHYAWLSILVLNRKEYLNPIRNISQIGYLIIHTRLLITTGLWWMS